MLAQNLLMYKQLQNYEQELKEMILEIESYLNILSTDFQTKEKIYVQEAFYKILTSLRQQKMICEKLRYFSTQK